MLNRSAIVTTTRVKQKPGSPPARENIRANLIVARAQARITQAQLADAASVTRQTISDLERGTVNISVDVLDRISRALDIETGQLFARPFTGIVDAAEIRRRRALPRSESVDADALFAALDEASSPTSAPNETPVRPSVSTRRRP
jgi:transcriptional regulator with XRE-family HTH domain